MLTILLLLVLNLVFPSHVPAGSEFALLRWCWQPPDPCRAPHHGSPPDNAQQRCAGDTVSGKGKLCEESVQTLNVSTNFDQLEMITIVVQNVFIIIYVLTYVSTYSIHSYTVSRLALKIASS